MYFEATRRGRLKTTSKKIEGKRGVKVFKQYYIEKKLQMLNSLLRSDKIHLRQKSKSMAIASKNK